VETEASTDAGGDAEAGVAAPTITSFTATSTKISRGTATSLVAVFSGGTAVVDQGVGTVTSGVDVATGNLTKKTTFTLTVTNASGDAVTATVDVDVKRELFASGYLSNSVLVFDEDASGAPVPKRSITTATFNHPRGISVVNDEIYVINCTGNGIYVYDLMASGNVVPKRAITGAATTLNDPTSIFVTNNEIFVGNRLAESVSVWNTADDGNVAPKRNIVGAATTLQYPNGVAVDGTDLYVVNEDTPYKVNVFPANGTGDIAPSRSFTAAQGTGLMIAGNELFVTDLQAPGLTVYDKTTGAQLRQIAGNLTTFIDYAEQCVIVDLQVVCANYENSTIVGFPTNGTGNIAPTRVITSAPNRVIGLYVY
jgi:hypothetical protein